jgi:hypothetical protein
MNDLIQTIKVLTEEEVKIINDYVDELTFQETLVFDSGGEMKVDTSVRSSLGATMNEEHQATKLIHQKINESLLTYREKLIKINKVFQYYPVPGGYWTTSNREPIQVLEYSPNQKYKFHHDTSNNLYTEEYHRIISVVLYLNNNFEGGGTEFPHQTYKPFPGYGLFFPSNWCFPHSGQKVLSGKKRVAVTWYYVIDHRS